MYGTVSHISSIVSEMQDWNGAFQTVISYVSVDLKHEVQIIV